MDKGTNKKKINPKQTAALVLAYVGDSVYEVYVRTRLISEHPDMPVYKLHKEAIRYVKAHAQSESLERIISLLTDEETAIYKRGRNAKSATVPKNADVTEYRRATGFEALLGYLYLDGQNERLEYLMKKSFEIYK